MTHPLTKEEAENTVKQRIELIRYDTAMKIGVQCGDGRNEEGLTAFGAELMGVGYPVLKQIETEEGRELGDDEVARFINHYPDILVMHTDAYGLEHFIREIQRDSVLQSHFTKQELQHILEHGLLTDHVRKLLEGKEGRAIEDALVSIADHLDCQGCGHVKTVMNEEHRDEAPDAAREHLADRMLKAHVRRHLRGSDRNRIVVYKGEHEERGVIVVETDGVLDSDDDLVPALTSAGERRDAFYIHPQIAKYRSEQVADFSARLFSGMKFAKDRKGFVQRVHDFQQSEAMITARRLAPDYPIYKATVGRNGKVVIEDGGHIPGKEALQK